MTYINRYVVTSGTAVLVVPKRSQTFHEKPQEMPVPPKPIRMLPDDYIDNHTRSIRSILSCKRVMVNKMGLRAVFSVEHQCLRWCFVISIKHAADMEDCYGFASAVKDHVQYMYGDDLPIMYLIEKEAHEKAENKDERLSWPDWPKRAFVEGLHESISVTFAIEENECRVSE